MLSVALLTHVFQLRQTMPDDPVTAAMEEAVGLLADGYEPITVEEWWDVYFDCAG